MLTRAGERFTGAVAVPSALGGGLRWRTVMAARVDASEHWKARVYVFDPGLRPGGLVRLGFLQNLAEQVGPPLLNFYLLRRLRSAAATAERARVAHELHDGAIQTLLGLELRLEVLRRKLESTDLEIESRAQSVAGRDRPGPIREVVELLRPVSIESKGLGFALADLVQRFGRNHGVDTAFEWARVGWS